MWAETPLVELGEWAEACQTVTKQDARRRPR